MMHVISADLDQRGHLNRMLRFWAQLERATAFSPSAAGSTGTGLWK